jgi:hypothetical protein
MVFLVGNCREPRLEGSKFLIFDRFCGYQGRVDETYDIELQ